MTRENSITTHCFKFATECLMNSILSIKCQKSDHTVDCVISGLALFQPKNIHGELEKEADNWVFYNLR